MTPKSLGLQTALTFVALLLAGSVPAAAAESARGSYQFTLGDRLTKYVEFDAQALAGGGASGRLFYSDEAEVTEQDVDGVGDPEERQQGFYFSADLDGLTVSGNRAVISGTVRDASIASLVGQRVLLTVEDNGTGEREPDKLTWGVYKPVGSWETSDAELERDPGVGMTWETSDAEREDDVPVRMPPDTSIGTQTFPFSAYAFVDTSDGAGDIVVQS
ncbi:MAG TPA: hypothetical protein VN282_07285 [Pyrinomonadaceae bacterium]|nr:hypothetical protein [Pyrinomonadaceae bacterium]